MAYEPSPEEQAPIEAEQTAESSLPGQQPEPQSASELASETEAVSRSGLGRIMRNGQLLLQLMGKFEHNNYMGRKH